MKKINWRYAIGEIIIVIIGISIAFGLNNWRDSQADQALKKQYLELLVSDIEQEIDVLQDLNNTYATRLERIKTLRSLMYQDDPSPDTIRSIVFKDVSDVATFNPVNVTYQTLINSGDMKLIDNFQLRRQIVAHYAAHQQVLENYERMIKIHQTYLADFFIYDLDYSKLQKGEVDFLFENTLSRLSAVRWFKTGNDPAI